MKRIAAPMVGGLVTSAFLTLVIIPLISTYWRQEQLLHELVEPLDPVRLSRMRIAIWVLGGGWILGIATATSLVYVTLPHALLIAAAAVSVAAVVGGLVLYLILRPAARQLVWPAATSIDGSPT
jgi:Cu(I)/Ag(I) efflux system membrane protein CusA/SilA